MCQNVIKNVKTSKRQNDVKMASKRRQNVIQMRTEHLLCSLFDNVLTQWRENSELFKNPQLYEFLCLTQL